MYDHATINNTILIEKNSDLYQNEGIYTILIEGIGNKEKFEFTLEYTF